MDIGKYKATQPAAPPSPEGAVARAKTIQNQKPRERGEGNMRLQGGMGGGEERNRPAGAMTSQPPIGEETRKAPTGAKTSQPPVGVVRPARECDTESSPADDLFEWRRVTPRAYVYVGQRPASADPRREQPRLAGDAGGTTASWLASEGSFMDADCTTALSFCCRRARSDVKDEEATLSCGERSLAQPQRSSGPDPATADRRAAAPAVES